MNEQQQKLSELIDSTTDRLGDFSGNHKREILNTITEAKKRGLLKAQPYDRCLHPYINLANHILRVYKTDEFTTIFKNLDQLYVYVSLVSTNSITVTA